MDDSHLTRSPRVLGGDPLQTRYRVERYRSPSGWIRVGYLGRLGLTEARRIEDDARYARVRLRVLDSRIADAVVLDVDGRDGRVPGLSLPEED